MDGQKVGVVQLIKKRVLAQVHCEGQEEDVDEDRLSVSSLTPSLEDCYVTEFVVLLINNLSEGLRRANLMCPFH